MTKRQRQRRDKLLRHKRHRPTMAVPKRSKRKEVQEEILNQD